MIGKKKEEKATSVPVHFADDDSQTGVETPDPSGVRFAKDSISSVADAQSVEAEHLEAPDTSDPASSEADETVSLAGLVEEQRSNESAAVAGGESEAGSTIDSEALSEDEQHLSQTGELSAGPMLAELVATRAELRRVETERNDLMERLARRQADFENYRKRVERERGETFQRMVGDVVSKLLPVMDNMRRALQAESLLEKNESAEFRHFLRGVELIYRQLNDALHELGVEAVKSVGQPFDPHVHEAVATEHSDEYEPDTVTQELLRGYRLGEKLLRPAMVKVSTRQ